MKPIQPVVFMIWAALCFALIAYAVMLSAITFVPAKAAQASLTNIFALVAGCSAALSFFLRKLLLGGFTDGTQDVDDPAGRGRFLAGDFCAERRCGRAGIGERLELEWCR